MSKIGEMGSSGRRLGCAAMAVIALGACDLGEPAQVAVRPTGPTPTALTPSPLVRRCSNEQDAVSGTEGEAARSLTGDVDGDGAADRVFLAVDVDGLAGCRSFVVVETATATAIAPADPGATEVQRGLPVPSLNSLVEIDGAGLEIIVDIEAGASTRFARIFTMKGGVLAQVDVRGLGLTNGGSPTADLFGYGGSVGHIDAVDCTSDASLVVSSAVPGDEDANRYDVERTFFELKDFVLRLVPSRTQRHTVPAADLERYEEFGRSPFGSCAL